MKYIIAFTLLTGLFACGKLKDESPGTSSITVINAVKDSKPLSTNYTSTGTGTIRYIDARRISYGGAARFITYSGNQQLGLWQYPDTTAKDAPLMNITLDLPVGSINTLVLTGTVTDPDTLMIRDEVFTFAANDSTMAFRFANFSPGTTVRLKIKDAPNDEYEAIPYNTVTPYKKYAVNTKQDDYVFEFLDNNGVVVGSYRTQDIKIIGTRIGGWRWIHHHHTLMLVGVPGGTSPYNLRAVMLNHSQYSGNL